MKHAVASPCNNADACILFELQSKIYLCIHTYLRTYIRANVGMCTLRRHSHIIMCGGAATMHAAMALCSGMFLQWGIQYQQTITLVACIGCSIAATLLIIAAAFVRCDTFLSYMFTLITIVWNLALFSMQIPHIQYFNPNVIVITVCTWVCTIHQIVWLCIIDCSHTTAERMRLVV